jgi:hypothetical protein
MIFLNIITSFLMKKHFVCNVSVLKIVENCLKIKDDFTFLAKDEL